MSINVLILAAGEIQGPQGEREHPSCLAEMDGKSLIERIVENTSNLNAANYVFAAREADCAKYHLDKIIRLLVPSPQVVQLPEHTGGAACTALLSACQLPQDDSLLIISANELVDIDLSEAVRSFEAGQLNAGTIIFRSIHPRYSYVRLNDEGDVVEAAQRDPISHNATTGVFWFEKTRDFVAAVQNMIRKDASVQGSYYIAPAINELVLAQRRIGVFKIANEKYIPLKNGPQIEKFESGAA